MPLGAPDGNDEEPAPPQPRRLPAYIERARATHRRAWARWTREEDAQLTALFERGDSPAEIVQALGRQPGAIRSRLLKLGLISETEGEDAPAESLRSDQATRIANPATKSDHVGNLPGCEPASPLVPGRDLFRQRLGDETPIP